MMFKFNFEVPKDEIDCNTSNEPSSETKKRVNNPNENTISKQHSLPKCSPNDSQIEKECEEISPEGISTIGIMYRPFIFLNKILCATRVFMPNEISENAFLAKYENCDVESSIYEGGLQIWECTYDLLRYFMDSKLLFKGNKVLDLGCGAGILGIYAAETARTVHFQDYNAEVLKELTIPNVLENCSNTMKIKFFSGDWSKFADSKLTEDYKYDFILSSEILYNPSHYAKLCRIFDEKLTSQGKVFLASKSYYFGVGGSTHTFIEFLRSVGKFEWDIVWKTSEGVRREIICLTRKT